MKKFPGTMVVLEGIDGCGKTTIGKRLVEQNVENWMFLASPSWDGTGAHIREILTGKRPHPGAWTLQMLFAVDRYEVEQGLLIPALLDGKTVVCDRWFYSGMMYGTFDGLNRTDVLTLYKGLTVVPDLVVHLKVDPAVSVTREGKGQGSDLYDGNLSRQTVLAGLYDTYLNAVCAWDFTRQSNMSGLTRHQLKTVDANQPLDQVQSEVLEAIRRVVKP